MPISVELSERDRRLEVTAHEQVTVAECRAAVSRGVALLRRSGPLPVLIDWRDSTPTLTTEEIRHVADAFEPGIPFARQGIAVVAVEGLQYGLARMLQALLENHGLAIGVFSDMNEALAWLHPRRKRPPGRIPRP